MSPRVSVVMAAHDAERYIGGAISSILAQAYRDLELIVVDDASQDGTAQIVASHPGPIRLITLSENAGPSGARNAGIDASAGELVTFLDSDDYVFPPHLEKLVELWDERGGIVTSNSWYLYPGGIDARRMRHRGPLPRPDRQRMAILEQAFFSPMSLIPRDLGDRIGWFDPSLRHAEDWDLWIRAIFEGARVSLVPTPTALYRVSADSLSASVTEQDVAVAAVLRKTAARDDLTDAERSYVERRLRTDPPHAFVRRADEALKARRYLKAARMYRTAAALAPSERRLVWKARALMLAPPVAGPLIRRRQNEMDRRLTDGAGVER